MNKRVVAGVAALLIAGGAALAGPAVANADGSGSGGSSADHPSGDELTAAEIQDILTRVNADLSDEGMSDAGLQHNGVEPAGAIDVMPGG